MPAETCIRLLKTKLFEFELSLDRDIVAITTDGGSAMCKVGCNVEAFHQICLAHGIHLGVSDVLYRKATDTEYDENETSDDDESEDEDSDNDVFTSIPVSVPRKTLCDKNVLRSPTKNDALQKYVRVQEGRDLALVLDCKTRWSSLADMIERFNRLKTCIEKTLIDFNSASKFSQEEFELLHSIQKSLKIVKITVEALCRRDATLLTAEAALKYMLRKLDNQKTNLSKSLAESLRKCISEKRQPLTAILQYLHDSEEYFNAKTRRVNHLEFPRMSCDEMITSISALVQRLQEQTNLHSLQNTSEMSSPAAEKDTSDDETCASSSSSSKNLTIKRNRSQIGEEENTIQTLIRIEMTLYENGGSRGRFLDATYKYLLSIPPTSVESERAFSAASYICNKIRSSLNDASLDALCFLRSIFQQKRSD
ncbi:hypothetical protein ABMA28_000348 [Loxostege sticticalis]|uniref:HAT C-terminal dimerisation domain-containing protein n=1 Tax=Loxostege sticticalis TaxID=481309 RepID=A0ABD0TRX8_LOXSC